MGWRKTWERNGWIVGWSAEYEAGVLPQPKLNKLPYIERLYRTENDALEAAEELMGTISNALGAYGAGWEKAAGWRTDCGAWVLVDGDRFAAHVSIGASETAFWEKDECQQSTT